MKNHKSFKYSILASVISLSLAAPSFAKDYEHKHAEQDVKVGMGKHPVAQAKSNQFWWPDSLDLTPLRDHDLRSNALGSDFDYEATFKELDVDALIADIKTTMKDSKDWWPADWGHYGPLFIRMTWHAAGTYRTHDGRGGVGGGQQRFDPLNSWPDNVSTDKARRLLWPVKKKYGEFVSWGDLIALAGTVALEDMGMEPYGFAFGRDDDWEPDLVYWGPEVEMLASDRRDTNGKLKKPLAAVHQGLIYVNPQGPNGVPDPLASARNIRESFGRMAMNDEETLALIAGGHTFGKAHGAHHGADCLSPEPGAAAIEDQGFGWKNKCGKGHSEDTITSEWEGAWTQAPTQWTSLYLANLMNNEWEKTKSPAGAIQWEPVGEFLDSSVPDAHIEGKFNAPIMFTTDIALKEDPEYRKIAERFLSDPSQFQKAFAKAWYKLTHRDMGPRENYLGKGFPQEDLVWQDPIPENTYAPLKDRDISKLKKSILASDLSVQELVRVAWGSAASYRDSDMRGGANGARIALAPQKDWDVNRPAEVDKVVAELKDIQASFNKGKKGVSLADLIVLGGAAAIEKAAVDAGVKITVPFTPGRGDATQAQTDLNSFSFLEPEVDGFRNYYTPGYYLSPTKALVDRADQLALTVPEMTVLVGGMRSLGANADGSEHGVFTDQPGTLNNDFFVELLDMSTKWKKTGTEDLYQGVDRETGKVKFTASSVDLIFGSSTELRAVAEVYAFDTSKERFVKDFVQAWSKVMKNDRFDLK